MNDSQMANISGAGIALAIQDARVVASPTSFLEFTGADVPNALSTESPAHIKRTDIRWYGLSITGSQPGSGSTWSGTCGVGISLDGTGMGCPRGGPDAWFAPFDNPLVLRVFDYTWPGFDYNAVSQTATPVTDHTQTILEVLYPSAYEPYRFAFWGEANVMNNNGTSQHKLQMQNIWNNVDQSGSSIRLFKYTAKSGNHSLGLIYTNHFAANIRMSVNQQLSSPDRVHAVPEFTDNAGMYLGHYRIYFPMGQLFYQTTVISATPCSWNGTKCGNSNAGNAIITQTDIPNDPEIYNDFYGRTIQDDPTGGYDRSKHDSYIGNDGKPSYERTHGYLRIGDWVSVTDYSHYSADTDMFGLNGGSNPWQTSAGACMADKTSCTENGPFDSDDGMFFRVSNNDALTVFAKPAYQTSNQDGSNSENSAGGGPVTIKTTNTTNHGVINLGDSQINGMLTQGLVITSCGNMTSQQCLNM